MNSSSSNEKWSRNAEMEYLKTKLLAIAKPEPDIFNDTREKLEYLKLIFDGYNEVLEVDQLIERVIGYREGLNDTTDHDPEYFVDHFEMNLTNGEGNMEARLFLSSSSLSVNVQPAKAYINDYLSFYHLSFIKLKSRKKSLKIIII